jgi:hypothetical protein
MVRRYRMEVCADCALHGVSPRLHEPVGSSRWRARALGLWARYAGERLAGVSFRADGLSLRGVPPARADGGRRGGVMLLRLCRGVGDFPVRGVGVFGRPLTPGRGVGVFRGPDRPDPAGFGTWFAGSFMAACASVSAIVVARLRCGGFASAAGEGRVGPRCEFHDLACGVGPKLLFWFRPRGRKPSEEGREIFWPRAPAFP